MCLPVAILPLACCHCFSPRRKSPAIAGAESTSPAPAEKRVVAPCLAERLAKFKNVKMPFDDSAYSARERQMILKLVDALQLADDIYWRQSDPAGLKLYLSLADSKSSGGRQLTPLSVDQWQPVRLDRRKSSRS
jgi:hypothetical protein